LTIVSETVDTVTEAFEVDRISTASGAETIGSFNLTKPGRYLFSSGNLDSSASIAGLADCQLIITEGSGAQLGIGDQITSVRVRLTNGNASAVILGCRISVTIRKNKI